MLNIAVNRVVLACMLIASAACVQGQSVRKASAREANVQSGAIVTIDSSDATLKLKTKAGADIAYRLTEKTRVYREKKLVEPSAFKAGDLVFVRFRKSSVGPAMIYDLADKASWEWLSRIRREMCEIIVAEIDDDSLKGTEGSDKAEIEYRITDKTAWSKGGKPATAADFKAGDRVFVEPRLLPSGNLMALAVADAASGAAILKERSRSTVAGSVKAIDAAKKTLALHTAAGEDRDFTLATDCTARLGSKDVSIATVRTGQQVTVHLVRDDDGEHQVSRINIGSKRSSKVRKPVKTPMKAPAKGMAKPG